MMNSIFKASICSALVLSASYVYADEPQAPTEPPYIVLSQNLDEPNGYGFCFDTYGPGRSELMQTHTCKPKKPEGTARDDSGHDVRFEYDSVSKQVSSYAFEGKCMQVLIAKGKSEFALLDCSDHAHQKFTYEKADQTLRLDVDQTYCVAVDTETQKAGPWVKRALNLVECDKTDASLKQWSIVDA